MLAALLLVLAQGFAPAPPTPYDALVPLEIAAGDPLLEGHGPCKRAPYSCEFDGTLHVWIRAPAGFETFLRVEDGEGKLLVQGERSPYVRLKVAPGRKLSIAAAAAQPGGFGKLELHIAAAPESEATRAANKQALQRIAALRKRGTAQEQLAARDSARALLAELEATPGARQSDLVAQRIWDAGREAYQLAIPETAMAALALLLPHLERTLPEEHDDLQRTRGALAATLRELGHFAEARTLGEKQLAVLERTLHTEDPLLQQARLNLAETCQLLGDLPRARELDEQALEIAARTLPQDALQLQTARLNLALCLRDAGEPARARALLEQACAAFERTLAPDDPDLWTARMNLAVTVAQLGDFAGARTRFEAVIEVFERVLPDDHPQLQLARQDLGVVLVWLRDYSAARALFEKVVALRARTLAEDHPDLQTARLDLATILAELGQHEAARTLLTQVLESLTRKLSDEHPHVQAARHDLAEVLLRLGDPAGARALQEKTLAVYARSVSAESADLHSARVNLAATLQRQGDLPGARALLEQALAGYERALPDEHPQLQTARESLALTLTLQAAQDRARLEPARARCIELVAAICRAQTVAARDALLTSSVREAVERCARLGDRASLALSFAQGCGVFERAGELDRAALVLGETTRGAALESAALMRRAAGAPRYFGLRRDLALCGDELAALVRKGSTAAEFRGALVRRETLERELLGLARALAGGRPTGLDFDAELLASALQPEQVALAFRSYRRWSVLPGDANPPVQSLVASLCAFVVRPGAANAPAQLARVELGALEPIERAVEAWRRAIGAAVERGRPVAGAQTDELAARGVELRRLVLDPLHGALAGARGIVVVLDDVLHLVPLDALPLDALPGEAPGLCAGDRWRIETRVTLTELCARAAPVEGRELLLSLGGASFNSEPLPPTAEDVVAATAERETAVAVSAVLRGGAWERGFEPLTYTGPEARALAELHDELRGEPGHSLVLEKRKASRAALVELAPKARWLHVATHGWFAPESVRTWDESEPIDPNLGLFRRLSGAEQVRGQSPLLLCGLALAGANLPVDALGRAPGLLTAEEVAALDLSHCELAVLSACDTGVGELRRAGQGVASLQTALQMAGARSAITSLWKVPDEATQVLMLDFYRRLWAEKKPKGQALWEAKQRLREARDEAGGPKYPLRDWAGWVLTGEPD